MKVFTFVLFAVVTIVALTSHARDIQPSITAQFCASQVPCERVAQMRLVRVDLEDGNDSKVLVFKEQSGQKIRIAFPSRSRALHVRIMVENGGYSHIYLPTVQPTSADSIVVFDEADIVAVERSSGIVPSRNSKPGRAN